MPLLWYNYRFRTKSVLLEAQEAPGATKASKSGITSLILPPLHMHRRNFNKILSICYLVCRLHFNFILQWASGSFKKIWKRFSSTVQRIWKIWLNSEAWTQQMRNLMNREGFEKKGPIYSSISCYGLYWKIPVHSCLVSKNVSSQEIYHMLTFCSNTVTLSNTKTTKSGSNSLGNTFMERRIEHIMKMQKRCYWVWFCCLQVFKAKSHDYMRIASLQFFKLHITLLSFKEKCLRHHIMSPDFVLP